MLYRTIVCCCALLAAFLAETASSDAVTVKNVLKQTGTEQNLLMPDRWQGWKEGFSREGGTFVCDNGDNDKAHRGVSQVVELNQQRPEPIVATAWSKAENVSGSPDANYSLYLDLIYMDGEPLWGQIAPFSAGTHDWEKKVVKVLPGKPVRSVSFHMLLREHGGKAWFRDPSLSVAQTPADAAIFAGLPVVRERVNQSGFQIRDVAASSDFMSLSEGSALGVTCASRAKKDSNADFTWARLKETTGKDRAITLVYSVPVKGSGWRWQHDPRRESLTEPGQEYLNTTSFTAGATGRLSLFPFAAIARGNEGHAIALDMDYAAYFQAGFSAWKDEGGELYIAYDLGLTPERPQAELRFCTFDFPGKQGFRGALARYCELFPDHFRPRTQEQGVWMPFAKISSVQRWEDFGFKFKEGNNETQWDDQHSIITFRYTEPMSWWMTMSKDLPRTPDAAMKEAKRLADAGNDAAKALLTSTFHDANGNWPMRFRNEPWCNGVVWSMNSDPGVKGDMTDFKLKWSPELADKLYGPGRAGDLDGEYVDSSEGYVTDELNFRRDHFADASAPLTFAMENSRPAIFRGLIAYAYVKGMARDVHKRGMLMMANGTPSRLCWLAPYLDVMGTETNWNYQGSWHPMTDASLLYRRALCGPKPFCFLMNTNFDDFSYEMVEKYMQRCLAYGMFPGFFSHNAAENHYFSQPALYNRDRPLFKKYVPLCQAVAEAGWRPVTKSTSSDARVCVERWGDRYLTVFNDSGETRNARIECFGVGASQTTTDLVTGRQLQWTHAGGKSTFDIELQPESVAVVTLR
ncbi:MAG: hypothetical protein GW893_11265 [Armatimonadetes bacterium]|nr:hypothetical protein [Armatimonadota bacterium]PIX41318.1 MAG: hypothetical protein COZ56_12415 [Armatimonadetes bacterium CG_4_8_14_3_um_filter_58_9]